MMASRVKAELKQAPLMLGKLLGGSVAVAGFTMAVIIGARKAGSSFADVLPFLVMGGAGIAVFVSMSRLLARRPETREASIPGGNKCESMVSWGILLLLALAFLLTITSYTAP